MTELGSTGSALLHFITHLCFTIHLSIQSCAQHRLSLRGYSSFCLSDSRAAPTAARTSVRSEMTNPAKNPDILSLLQSQYTLLHQQIFSTTSYLSQRHPLAPPPSDPYSRNVITPGREDTDPAQTAHPLHPVSQEVFAESQVQLSEDLVRKFQQILKLVEKLPGGDRGEVQQKEEVRRLTEELRGVELERKESRRQMKVLAGRLDAVVAGMSTNIEMDGAANGTISDG